MIKLTYRTIAARYRLSRWGTWVLGPALLFMLIAPLLNSQKPSQPLPTVNGFPPPLPEPSQPFDSKVPDYGPAPIKALTFEEKQYLRYIASLLKSMTPDSERLLFLARELNTKIEKSGPGSLSREDLHTLAEIEKLAHQVKWKMQLASEANTGPNQR